jgi:tripartite-type tricarboxylate transporter receptor subunit TctC
MDSLQRHSSLLYTFAIVSCAFGFAHIAVAQNYPIRPIRLIVPSAPGGAPDITARLIGNELTQQMNQQVVIDNRPGASGVLGFELIAKAVPDGYTLGAAIFPFSTNPSVYAKLPYDTERDFQAVIRQHTGSNILAVTPSLPVRSVRDLIAHARANPDKLSYGSTGGGTTNVLTVEMFKMMTGTRIMQVNYKGIQQAIAEMIAGQIHIVCDNTPSILPHVRAGRVRALAVTTLKRSPSAPEIPTFDESGLPGFELATWSGYMVQAGVPRNIVIRLNAEIGKALALPTVTDRLMSLGYTPVGGTPEEFAQLIRSETAKWAKVIKAAGINPQ